LIFFESEIDYIHWFFKGKGSIFLIEFRSPRPLLHSGIFDGRGIFTAMVIGSMKLSDLGGDSDDSGKCKL